MSEAEKFQCEVCEKWDDDCTCNPQHPAVNALGREAVPEKKDRRAELMASMALAVFDRAVDLYTRFEGQGAKWAADKSVEILDKCIAAIIASEKASGEGSDGSA